MHANVSVSLSEEVVIANGRPVSSRSQMYLCWRRQIE